MANAPDDFEAQARQRPQGALRQFISFALNNKKWWLTPVIVVLVLVGLLAVLGGSGVAPFIYSLF
jgi:Family of unknown function (DUF5989)